MITREMIKEGCEKGLVRLFLSPDEKDIMCQIGKKSFYFCIIGDKPMEEVEAYVAENPGEEVIDELHYYIGLFKKLFLMDKDYEYYETYLREKLYSEQTRNVS